MNGENTVMKNSLSKLLMIASTALGVAGLVFLCLAIFGYEKAWTLSVALSLLYLSIFRLRDK